MPTAFIVDPFEILDTGKQTVLKKRLETHFADIATMGHTPLFKVQIISGAARLGPDGDPTASDVIVYISPDEYSILRDFGDGERGMVPFYPKRDGLETGGRGLLAEGDKRAAASEIFQSSIADLNYAAAAIVHEAFHNRLFLDNGMHKHGGIEDNVNSATRVSAANARHWAAAAKNPVVQWKEGQKTALARKARRDHGDKHWFW
ncbi:MAG: hypothetical protein FWD68_08875 [Alphaproteobacteria bacterium]|nr:hypothetical protein [Alphaproteobacteria bacterium]